MAGLIKNQILKHLSRYAKNLSSDKINLSTFKGEGELRNLELDQEVMTELLSLPSWMKLTHATCNHVLIRIPWTKLKSVPIHLSLDEVNIRVEACEELRAGNENNPLFPPPAFGKYGFVNKVIDGITATVNSVEITFHSREFESKVQISRIRVESRSPEWKKCELSGTRLKDLAKGETLIFKEMEWQTLRLEARSTLDRHLAPLRLLANQAKARIAIKKNLNNSQVVGCRLSLILDDLLWVLTDSQILAALHFMSSLSGLVKQATETTQRMKAARKLESLPEYQAQISQTNAVDNKTLQTKFDLHDVRETSYHFNCEKIDLHFCDDPGSGRSQHPDLKDGGALQLSLNQVMVDFYPYHLAVGSRKFWQKYTSNTLAQWLQQALKNFKISLIDTLSNGSLHTPLSRTNPPAGGQQKSVFESNPIKDQVTTRLGKLMSSCLIVKIQDMSFFRVTTSSKRTSPLPFISTFIERPKELPVIHTEFSWFYYPGEICFPLPSAKIYAYLHPIQIQLDVCTILWLNSFLSNLGHSMAGVTPQEEPDYVDVRVEMLMPKIIFENPCDYPGQKDRPNSLHIQVSRLILSNYRSTETGTHHQLTQCIELLQRGDLIYGSSFPSKEEDVPLLQEKFVSHAEGRDKLRPSKKLNSSSFTEISGDLTKDLLWTEPRDVWFIHLDPCWADFHVEEKRKRLASESGSISSKKKIFNKPAHGDGRTVNTVIYPFIDATPVSIWVYVNEKDMGNRKLEQKNIHAILSASEVLKVQLTHFQFLFLMRTIEALGEMSLYLTLDSKAILGNDILKNVVTVVGYIKAVEVSLLFPPSIPEKQETPSMEFNAEEPRFPQSQSADAELTNHNDQEDRIVGQMATEQRGPLFHRPFVPLALSTSHMTRNLGGGSNPNLGSNPGNGFPGMSHSVKHSLTNLAVSFNKCGGVATPDSEIVSNWSNVSSDSSDNFVQLDVGEQELGSVTISSPSAIRQEDLETDSEIEVAVEMEEHSFVDERSTPSPIGISQDISTSRAEHDTITSVLTVLLQGVEIGQEGHGLTSAIKLQAKSVTMQELPEISWKDFQDKFCGRKRSSADNENRAIPESSNPTQRRAVKLRLSQNINAEGFMKTMSSDRIIAITKEITSQASPRINLSDRPGAASPIRNAISEATSANIFIEVDFTNEGEFKLHTSSCTGLADLLEDEILPTPIPLNLDLMGVNLELIEDRPPANITSPGPIPLKIDIPFLNVSRDASGVFKVGPSYDPSGRKFSIVVPIADQGNGQAILPDDSEKEYLRQELEKMTQQLQQCQLRNSALEEEREENECLKGLIVSLQDEVHKLQTEKYDLLRRYQQHNYH